MALGFGDNREKQVQLHFRDDRSFKFRSLPFEDSCLVEKKNGLIDRAWKHFYAGQLFCKGYKFGGTNIEPGAVTLAYDRDFILDPFNKVPATDTLEGKPRKGETALKAWTAQIAESQRYKVMIKGGNGFAIDRIVLFLGIAIGMECLIWIMMTIPRLMK